jgi:hypothetical protein
MNYSNPIIDYRTIQQNFLNIYYTNMSNTGLVNNLDLFDEKCVSYINGEEYIGAYHVLVRLAQTDINRFLYKTLHLSCQPIGTGYLISATGICQIVNFQNIITLEIYFTETFYINNLYKITNYIAQFG